METTTKKIEVTGIRDLLLHNGRLANPLDEYTQAIAAVSKKRAKTLADHSELARLEMRGAMYETGDGHIGLPAEAFWRCVYDAAKAFKLGEDVKRAVYFEPTVVPLMLNGGGPTACDKVMADADALFYVSVKIQKSRTMRARPRIRAGWHATFTIEVDESVLPWSKLVPVLDRAGRYGGLGNWRPLFGLFEWHEA